MSGIHVTYDILLILMWLVPLAQVWTRLGNCSNWEQKHDDIAQIVKKIIQVLNEFSLTKVIQNSISPLP